MSRGDEPGGAGAKKCGCTCSEDQPDDTHYMVDKDCPLHGLHIIKALIENG